MNQNTIPCIVYRGGTSRGVFFHEKDLPKDLNLRRKIFIHAIGSYDPTHVDGLGGGTSHTSKVAIMSPSDDPNADVNYTFVQLGLNENIVDYNGTCGNLMSAAGAFAVDEGLVKATEPITEVRVYNTNIKKYLSIKIPTENGHTKVNGDFYMSGLRNPGAKIVVDILNPGGATTGSSLPIGKKCELQTTEGALEVSFVDVVNPFGYVSASSFGLKGNEQKNDLEADNAFMKRFEEVRRNVAVQVGLAEDINNVSEAVPKMAFVSKPQDYKTVNGELIKSDQVDIVAKMTSVGRIHSSFAVSGLMNIASAVLLEGTIPNSVANQNIHYDESNNQYTVRIGHANGVASVKVTLTNDKNDIAAITLDRHARRIMKGDLFIPNTL
ncbi:PrpF domain-containing protein [Bacillaceae bacterium W0354]